MNRYAIRFSCCILGAIALLSLGNAAHAQYKFISFDAPVVGNTVAFGINTSGLVSGQYVDASGNFQVFTYQNGTFQTLITPNSIMGFAGGPNAQGQIPISWMDSSFNIHAAIAQNGNFTLLPDAPGYLLTAANSINGSGTVAGFISSDPTFATGSGFVYDGSAYHPFDYPGASLTVGYGINDAEVVVGIYVDGNGVQHGYQKEGNTLTSLDYPGNDSLAAFGISNDGVIEGAYGINGRAHGFLLDNGVYTTVNYPGATDTYVNYRDSITGSLVGSYSTDNGLTFHAFIASTPEPGVLALFIGVGVSSVSLLGRRRTRN